MPKTVCVTGATGFIAAFVVEELLQRGYVVHGTVRDLSDQAKHAHLLVSSTVCCSTSAAAHTSCGARSSACAYHHLPVHNSRTEASGVLVNQAFEGADERLKLFQCDVTDTASLAEPIAGCDCVMHTATPVIIPMTGEEPQTRAEAEEAQLRPAVEGVVGVIEECHKAGVGHMVLTSSVAAISGIAPQNMPTVLDEDCWSDEAFLEDTGAWYTLAKTRQERKAWELATKHGIKLCTVCPPLVLGRLHTPHFNYSHHRFVEIIDGTLTRGPLGEHAWLARYGVVDVEDVALCHVRTGNHTRSPSVTLLFHFVLFRLSVAQLAHHHLADLDHHHHPHHHHPHHHHHHHHHHRTTHQCLIVTTAGASF
jgi:nucleoside-diphosphate-sugar epimerase